MREREDEDETPDLIDRHIGRRLKGRRLLLEISQKRLAEFLGLSFQQIQKYEAGTSRLHSQEINLASIILRVSHSYFFDGLDDGLSPAEREFNWLLDEPETIGLVQTFWKIMHPEIRASFSQFTRAVADHSRSTNA